MKVEKNKHDHKGTEQLKIIIFSLLMLAPLIASVSQMLYATFNPNAKDSTEITGQQYHVENEYQTNEVNSVEDLVVGNIYKCNMSNLTTTTNIMRVQMLLYGNTQETICETKNTSAVLWFESLENGLKRFLYNYVENNQNYIYYMPIGYGEIDNIEIYIVYDGWINPNNNIILNFNSSDYLGEQTIVAEPVHTLDNAFYYGVDQMTKSELFNWTESTLLYNGVKGMTDNLGVQTNAIAILITYWTILTIIYVILDIVIEGFKFITHLIVKSD